MKMWTLARTVCLFLVWAAMVVVPISPTLAQVSSEHGDKIKTPGGYSQLRAKASQEGAVRIMVEVDAPFSAEPLLAEKATGQQRSIISQTQDRLLKGLGDAGKHESVYKYSRTPYIAMTVDGPSLDALLALPETVTVHEDIPNYPVLDKSVPFIGAATLHSLAITGSGYKVAVLDSGVDKDHPFLEGSVVFEACYSTNDPVARATSLCPRRVSESTDDGSAKPYGGLCPPGRCSHGTQVAGIVAGRSKIEGSPGPGVAPEAGIIAMQVFTRMSNAAVCRTGGLPAPCVVSYPSDQKKALNKVYELRDTHKIAAVNMSIGGPLHGGNCDSDPRKADIDNLRNAGIVTIVASGNDQACGSMAEPACISSAVSVGATDLSDAAASYSNSSLLMTLFAPGSGITSSVAARDGSYKADNGTSFAAPHVAGAWALLKQAKPDASIDEILAAFTSTGFLVTDLGKCPQVAKRRINVNDAYKSMVSKNFLTVTKTGIGKGVVTSSVEGINCGTRCAAPFDKGSVITLTAAASGNVFAGWSGGGCSGTDVCTVTMTDNLTVTASFGSPCTYTISPDRMSVGSKGGEATVQVIASGQGACGTPSVQSNSQWFFGSVSALKNNRGRVLLKILGNDNPDSRIGTMTIADKTFTLTQTRTSCSLPTLTPSSTSFSSAAGSGKFTVNMKNDCQWIAEMDQWSEKWITITSATGMSGQGEVTFNVSNNTSGRSRTGRIYISIPGAPDHKRVFRVTQEK